MAFLLIYILCSLAVAEKYNRVDDDSRTGLQTDGAAGLSMKPFAKEQTQTGFFFRGPSIHAFYM